ncbi:hypothetical protein F511_02052 [Dorcoceras hygrometricum]|uniref:Uncharacterized protein n=1 Tax=Dorcoceras hygrometricum TaxID=472368 RepID=A0A2Z7BYN5_9LAMI|nr:hypothetical protein F511_02052 [Dorcoceras hygrometricum]
MKATEDSKDEDRRRIRAKKKTRATAKEAEDKKTKMRNIVETTERPLHISGVAEKAPGKGGSVTKRKLKLLPSESESSTLEDSQALKSVYTSKSSDS